VPTALENLVKLGKIRVSELQITTQYEIHLSRVSQHTRQYSHQTVCYWGQVDSEGQAVLPQVLVVILSECIHLSLRCMDECFSAGNDETHISIVVQHVRSGYHQPQFISVASSILSVNAIQPFSTGKRWKHKE